jgi:hypothetical protein
MQIREVTKDWAVFVKLLNYGSYLLDSVKRLNIGSQCWAFLYNITMCVYLYLYTVNGQSSVNRDSFIFFR